MGPLAVNEIISENTDFFLHSLWNCFWFCTGTKRFFVEPETGWNILIYDGVVLKVFFTAAITAMLGLLFSAAFRLDRT